MVASPQGSDREAGRGGPRPAGRGWQGNARPVKRTNPQNDLLHALIRAAVKGGLATDDGRRLTFYEAKVALVTAWQIEEGYDSDIVAFNGQPIQLRRSTAELSKAELSSLAEFIQAACASRGIQMGE